MQHRNYLMRQGEEKERREDEEEERRGGLSEVDV